MSESIAHLPLSFSCDLRSSSPKSCAAPKRRHPIAQKSGGSTDVSAEVRDYGYGISVCDLEMG